ncbi:MAG: ATPase, partial [Betaproteobacteria bacterium]
MNAPPIGLGMDAGGTRTRWALADASRQLLGSGEAPGMTALQMNTDAGRDHIRAVLRAIMDALPKGVLPGQVCAGITGHTEGGASLAALIASQCGLDPAAVSLRSDIEIA